MTNCIPCYYFLWTLACWNMHARHSIASASAAAVNDGSEAASTTPPSGEMLSEDMRVFFTKVLAQPNPCNLHHKARLYELYIKNKQIFDLCANESCFALFPNSKTLPTSEQIEALITSKSCLIQSTALVQLELQECNSNEVSARCTSESMLRVRHDVIPTTLAKC